jgi:predicted esterase
VLAFQQFLKIIFTCILFNSNIAIAEDLMLTDKIRNRNIPIEIYNGNSPSKIAIINHGYGVKNTEYTFIASALVEKGFLVISIQHDLQTDPPLPRTGNLYEKRKPIWERGVKNILFTISELKTRYPDLDWRKLILIGHSNGGDISMLFATEHPELVAKVISLDSLRMPFPTKNNTPILSIRAGDTKADEGVLPKSGATIITLKDAKHNDMHDKGSDELKTEIIDSVMKFLDD